MADSLEKICKISKINLDKPAWGEVEIPHNSQLTTHNEQRTTDHTNQTSEVFETSEVFNANHNFIRRGAWHAPAVQYFSTPVFNFLTFKPVQIFFERGRIEGGMGYISTPFFRFGAGCEAFLRLDTTGSGVLYTLPELVAEVWFRI